MPRRTKILWLVLVTWVPLVVLAAAGGVAIGNGVGVPLLADYSAWVRFLVALPVLVAAEVIVWARVDDLAHYLVRSGVVAEPAMPALERLVARLHGQRKTLIVPIVAAVCVALGITYFRKVLSTEFSTWEFVPGTAGQVRSAAGWWYLLVSQPILQFLTWFWILRYGVWCWFLFRLSRLDLRLVASHPDGSAGLRPIGQVHQFWAVVVFAFSSILSAHIGLELVHGRSIGDFRVELAAFMGLSLVVLFAPFLVFSTKLLNARLHGLLSYGVFAADYTKAFDAKWIGRRASEHDLLGTGDIQSLADLSNSYQVVRGVRLVPFEMMNVVAIVMAVAIPFIPLVFSVVSPLDVVKGLAQMLL